MLRATSSLVSFWVSVVVAILLLGDAAVRGRWDVVAVAAAPVAFAVWVMWLLLWRPGIRVAADRAVVTNIGRIHDLPWSRVADVTDRMQVVFGLDDGTTVKSWGGPFSRGSRSRGRQADADTARALDVIERAREASAPTDDPVRHRWDAVALSAGAVLAIIVAVEAVFL